VLANDVVDDALVRRERVEALLLDLGPSILGGVQENIVGDALVVLAIGLAGGRSEDADCEAGVAGGRVGDPVELVVGDDVLVEAPLRPRTQDVVQLLVVVLVHPDVFAGAQPAHETVVDAAEQFLFLVRDADDRELREAVEVVDDAGVLQLIDLVEDDDRSRTVVLLEPVDEFVVRRRLPVDVDGRAEVVEDLVERPKPGVVAPAIHIGTLNIQRFLTKAFSDEFRDAGFAGPAGSGDDSGVGGFAIRDWFEDAREVIDFGVAMLYFSRDESGPEDASIADHLSLID
jgi:hypothetical protein